MAKLVSMSVLVLGLAVCTHGACFRDSLFNATGPYGNVREVCYITDFNLTITVGDYLESYDTCYYYNCTKHGMEACGFGVRAGILVAQGCITQSRACQPVFVQDPKSTHKCAFDPLGSPATGHTIPPTRHSFHRPTPNSDAFCKDPLVTGPLRDQVCASTGNLQRAAIATVAVMLITTFFMYAVMN